MLELTIGQIVIALVWIVIAEGITDAAVVTLAVIGFAAVLGGAGLTAMILYREQIAGRIGDVTERSYNKLAGGRWEFPEGEGLGGKMVDLRGRVIGTLKARWLPARVIALVAQALFFITLVMSIRYVGVTSEQASLAVIFDAYAIGLLLSMIPIFPGGLGVVELAYVGVIVGNAQNSDPGQCGDGRRLRPPHLHVAPADRRRLGTSCSMATRHGAAERRS